MYESPAMAGLFFVCRVRVRPQLMPVDHHTRHAMSRISLELVSLLARQLLV
jgi:hypothetical protein